MNTQSQELEALVARVESLEQANRQMKTICLLVLTLAAMGVLMGQTKSSTVTHGDDQGKKVIRAGTIAANRIELTTQGGNLRGVLRAYESGSTFTMFDEYGKARLILMSSGEGGGALQMGDLKEPAGESKDWVYTTGNPAVTLHPGLLELNDQWGGKQHMNIVVGEDESALNLGKNAVLRVGLINGFHSEIGTSHLLTTSTGEEHNTSDASVVLFDDKGKVIWNAPN